MRPRSPKLLRLVVIAVLMAAVSPAAAAPAEQAAVAKPFVFVFLPDTGRATQDRPEVFAAQTKWIRENRDKLNIVYVAHAGNITAGNAEKEWQNANGALKILDGVVPYGLVGGPADTPKPKEVCRDTGLFNKYFPYHRYKMSPWYGWCWDKARGYNKDASNCYHVVSAGGMKFLIFYLEYGPRDDALAWMNRIAGEHPNHRLLLVTNSYLADDRGRITEKSAGLGPFLPPPAMNTGEQVWEKFVSRHANFFMVLSGRVAPARLTSEGKEKNKVFQLAASYLKDASDAGYLRLIKFVPNENKIHVSTWSPVLDRSLRDGRNEFALDYDMSRRYPAPTFPRKEDSFSLVVLPDTQCYTGAWMPCFTAQTEWIVRNKAERNIVFVAHEGDMTNNNTENEWRNGDACMKRLDGVVPYGIVGGNHDVPNCGKVTRDADLFNKYFPPERFRKNPGYGGCYENRSDNSWQTFSAFGMKFLVLCLEYGPRDEVVAWANGIVKEHPDHRVILVTHSYLSGRGARVTDKVKGDGPFAPRPQMNDGEQLWDNLVSRHKNFFMVLSGHVLPSARLDSKGREGNVVHQLAINYQSFEDDGKGGNGYLRVLTFVPKENRIYSWTYSPFADEYLREARNEFTLEYDMSVREKAGAARGSAQPASQR